MPCFSRLWGINLLIHFLWLLKSCYGGAPFVFFDWRFSYITAAPLGTKQQVIGVNGRFPGPTLNVTTNWNVVINVRNDLDEPLLLTWAGVQQRKNSWQDGVSGTNCPIPAGWNWTYNFQVKDQIGSFFYFPSLNFQRAAGGYGGITINNRKIIPIPFGTPDGDITLLISDWYVKSHKELRKDLEEGHDLGAPDGVLFNGLGPYHYDPNHSPGNANFLIVYVEPGRTYRLRVSNVGISTSLNFRIQSHNLILVETEGSYTVQQIYTDLDIHVGQSYSFLVTMDQDASSDYYIVASPRWNLTASAARPNPQGSFKYGQITVTDVYVLVSRPAELINGKWHATLNGLSYFTPSTPLKLAQLYKVSGVYKLDFPRRPMNRPSRLDTSLINATYKSFVEIILQNSGATVQTYHLDGYAFFVVGMDYGTWTEDSRSTYNKDDAVARCTTQVYPGAWTAIMVSLDNSGIWNLRAENLNSWYLGQELYLSVLNPEKDSSEVPLPDNMIYCGLLSSLQRDQSHRIHFSGIQQLTGLSRTKLVALVITVIFLLIR